MERLTQPMAALVPRSPPTAAREPSTIPCARGSMRARATQAERLGLAERRAPAPRRGWPGRVLEIGAGKRAELRATTAATVDEVVAVEPERHLRELAVTRRAPTRRSR